MKKRTPNKQPEVTAASFQRIAIAINKHFPGQGHWLSRILKDEVKVLRKKP